MSSIEILLAIAVPAAAAIWAAVASRHRLGLVVATLLGTWSGVLALATVRQTGLAVFTLLIGLLMVLLCLRLSQSATATDTSSVDDVSVAQDFGPAERPDAAFPTTERRPNSKHRPPQSGTEAA